LLEEKFFPASYISSPDTLPLRQSSAYTLFRNIGAHVQMFVFIEEDN
jgi:hypothetical protein